MIVGRYDLGWHTVQSFVRIPRDAARVRRRGIPRAAGATPADVAREVLRRNLHRGVLSAGAGKFRAMWVADTGFAFAGALTALPRDDLAALVGRMARVGAARGHVPTCFTPNGHYDSPWRRADNVPWLLHMVDLLGPHDAVRRADLETVYADWVRAHVEPRTGLVRRDVTGDWMDTVPRPSSTFNNLLALRAYQVADRLGLDAPAYAREAARALRDERWTGAYLRDHPDAGDYVSADANVPALYFGLFSEEERRAMAKTLESAGLDRPVPMRTREGLYARDELPWLSRRLADYHSVAWLHFGIMHLVGRARLGLPVDEGRAAVDATVREHGNFLETLDHDGRPMVTRWIATEYGFTMSAGLYLELASLVDASSNAVRTN